MAKGLGSSKKYGNKEIHSISLEAIIKCLIIHMKLLLSNFVSNSGKIFLLLSCVDNRKFVSFCYIERKERLLSSTETKIGCSSSSLGV